MEFLKSGYLRTVIRKVLKKETRAPAEPHQTIQRFPAEMPLFVAEGWKTMERSVGKKERLVRRGGNGKKMRQVDSRE